MTKKFIVHHRNDSTMPLEFSELRLSWYKKMVELWDNEKTQAQLNMYLSISTAAVDKPQDGRLNVDNMRDILDAFCTMGLMVKTHPKTGLSSIFSKITPINTTIIDGVFLNHCFYTNENSNVIHLTEFHLVEEKVDGQKTEILSDTNLREQFRQKQSITFHAM